ncbi:MAG: hypothetical protein R2911_36805, partial [Caldilineaceae bacterium]
QSFRRDIEIVPTLMRLENGAEVERTVGWDKATWRRMTGVESLGEELPEMRPGCGSKSVEPGMAAKLAVRFGDSLLRARRIELASLEDEMEACYERGWSDGLPLVPPTEERVLNMLTGTSRAPSEIVGVIPPDGAACTVEKVAINAVMAGCKPEYLPVVLAAVEAACLDEFCMHGLLATTWFSGPVVIVNGPIAKAIGMNAGVNALGQGNRANATIGRALQLVIRNVGGGRPGGVDRSCLGNPGKYTFCFAEREEDSPWESLAVERGLWPGDSAVTLFAGDGVQGIYDQRSRTPAALTQTFAECLTAVAHPRAVQASDAILVISPEHARVYREAGWSKARLRQELDERLLLPVDQVWTRAERAGASTERVAKFRPGGLHIVHAGGNAGMFSAIIGGWVASGAMGSVAVTQKIE